MVVIEDFDEGFNLVPLGLLLLAHPLEDRFGVSIDTGDQSVSIALVVSALVVVTEDDCLATGVLAGQYQDHLAWLHYLAHRVGSARDNRTKQTVLGLKCLQWFAGTDRKRKRTERERQHRQWSPHKARH